MQNSESKTQKTECGEIFVSCGSLVANARSG